MYISVIARVIFLFYFNAATSLMINPRQTESRPDFIEVKWDSPLHKPLAYKAAFVCTLIGNKSNYLSFQLKNMDSETSSIRVSKLLPETICKMKLIAVYNPASIDSGITFEATTSSKQRKSEHPKGNKHMRSTDDRPQIALDVYIKTCTEVYVHIRMYL